jgi:hypothetical protein
MKIIFLHNANTSNTKVLELLQGKEQYIEKVLYHE